MIDIGAYKMMHAVHAPKADDITEPPSGDIITLSPLMVNGFCLRTKCWSKSSLNEPAEIFQANPMVEVLEVERIREVVWNDNAFESLVIVPETKELLRALVTNHSKVESEPSADFMAEKGNGLIILLHGNVFVMACYE
jgi:hypothetical protein